MKTLKPSLPRLYLSWKPVALAILGITGAALSASAAISINYSLEGNAIRLSANGSIECYLEGSAGDTLSSNLARIETGDRYPFPFLQMHAGEYGASDPAYSYTIEGYDLTLKPSGVDRSDNIEFYSEMSYSEGLNAFQLILEVSSNSIEIETNLGSFIEGGSGGTLMIDNAYVEYTYENENMALMDYNGIIEFVGSGFSAYDIETGTTYFNVNATPVPEPTTVAYLAAGGAAAFGLILRRRRRAQAKRCTKPERTSR